MPLEDLDLEFEDEEEQKRKRNDSLHDTVDLEFGAAPEKPAAPSIAAKPAAVAAADSSVPKAAPSAAGAQVKKIEEVRAKIAQAKNPGAAPTQSTAPAARALTNGSSALQLAPEPGDVNLAQLYQMMEDTKFEARVQVAVAQEKGEFMAEVLSDAKLMQHQVQQLLMRLNQKNPALKPELMAIQKALADFLAKKRK